MLGLRSVGVGTCFPFDFAQGGFSGTRILCSACHALKSLLAMSW
jgi:hypothetical protein